MTVIDVHSHWGTERGYPLRTKEELAQQMKTWNSPPTYATEAEMAQYFRDSGVRAILDFHFSKFLPFEEMVALHDYGFATERAHPDAIIGQWIHVDPRRAGPRGLQELRRCIDHAPGFIGFGVSASLSAPASDPSYDPYYKLCIEANVPVLVFVGTTGLGAGLPGGGGVVLDSCHPRHLDATAAKYPELTLVAGRPGWPWQTEELAVLLHKRDIWCELHGWSPKYLAPDLKHEIPRRLKERVMFAADYPLFAYDRLVRDWRGEGYPEDVLEDVFHRNAERFLEQVRRR